MKRIKKLLAVMLVIIITTIAITGCNATTQNVAIINDEKISTPLYRIFLWTTQKYFESITPNIWNMEEGIDGKTSEEYAKESALSSLKLSIVAKQQAEAMNIKLTKEEKKQVKALAKAAMEENESFVKAFKVKQKYFEEFYTYDKLVDKVIEKLGENYSPNEEEVESNKEEVRVANETAVAEHILIKNKDEQGGTLPSDKMELARQKAESILREAVEGKDFEILIKTYSEDEAVEEGKLQYDCKRGTMDAAFEKVVFEEAQVGEVYPRVVETANGYEIIKVLERSLMSEEDLLTQAEAAAKTKFASNELLERSEFLKIEKLEYYDQIHIMEPQ